MTLVDVELTQDPLVLEDLDTNVQVAYPHCMIGVQLKNNYDQKRIRFKSKYGVRDVIHLLPTSKIEPLAFRGITLEAKRKYDPLIKRLREYNTSLNDSIDIATYKKLLASYDLTCEDCYAFLRKGVYPIDGICLNRFANTELTIESLYSDAFNTKEVPIFQLYCSLTIFVLCNESVFPVLKS